VREREGLNSGRASKEKKEKCVNMKLKDRRGKKRLSASSKEVDREKIRSVTCACFPRQKGEQTRHIESQQRGKAAVKEGTCRTRRKRRRPIGIGKKIRARKGGSAAKGKRKDLGNSYQNNTQTYGRRQKQSAKRGKKKKTPRGRRGGDFYG